MHTQIRTYILIIYIYIYTPSSYQGVKKPANLHSNRFRFRFRFTCKLVRVSIRDMEWTPTYPRWQQYPHLIMTSAHTVLTSHTCLNDLMMCASVCVSERSVFHSQSHSPITYIRNEYLCTEIRAAYMSDFFCIYEWICLYIWINL